MNSIGTSTKAFCHHIANVVDNVYVIAKPSCHIVCTSASIECVIAAVTSDAVIQSIASAIDIASSREDEVAILTGKCGGGSGDEGIGKDVDERSQVVAGCVLDNSRGGSCQER